MLVHLLQNSIDSIISYFSLVVLLGGNTSPVSPHIQQNGFNNSASANVAPNNGNQVTGTQLAATMGQTFTGAGGTWTGSNTLTYTQSMQPPDNRNHHATYCKAFHYFNNKCLNICTYI